MHRGQVYPDVAARLVQDPWVTHQRADAWLRALQRDRSVRSLGAVLATNLRHHREPPPSAAVCPHCHNLALYCDCPDSQMRASQSDPSSIRQQRSDP